MRAAHACHSSLITAIMAACFHEALLGHLLRLWTKQQRQLALPCRVEEVSCWGSSGLDPRRAHVCHPPALGGPCLVDQVDVFGPKSVRRSSGSNLFPSGIVWGASQVERRCPTWDRRAHFDSACLLGKFDGWDRRPATYAGRSQATGDDRRPTTTDEGRLTMSDDARPATTDNRRPPADTRRRPTESDRRRPTSTRSPTSYGDPMGSSGDAVCSGDRMGSRDRAGFRGLQRPHGIRRPTGLQRSSELLGPMVVPTKWASATGSVWRRSGVDP